MNADDFPHGRGVEFGKPDVAKRFETSPEEFMAALDEYVMACGALGGMPDDDANLDVIEQTEYVRERREALAKHVVAVFGRLAT